MVWDCLIAWVVIVFTMVGWSMGLLRSWTVPFSMAIATFIAQHVYIDLATLMVDTLKLEPTFSVFFAYVFSWLWLVQFCDHFLSDLLRSDATDSIPPMVSKVGGGALGFAKGAGAFVLAAMVAYASNKVPEPTHIGWADHWMIHAAGDSHLLPQIHFVAMKLDEPLGKYVLSDAAPRVKGDFVIPDPFAGVEKSEERRGYEIGRRWKQFETDMGTVSNSLGQ
jgi:uncharacterized membrane protein required for colicin V production